VVVLDASVLIALAKIRRLGVVQGVYREALIGPVVHAEAVGAGKRIGAPGVERIEHALDEGWLRVARPTPAERSLTARILRTSRLHGGEAEALALAARRRLPVVIDDKEARSVAGALGLDYMGTAGVLLEAFVRRRLTHAELEDAVVTLARVIWLSPSVVATILKTAREEKR
jgi:predicted nucleic acid-binding protein